MQELPYIIRGIHQSWSDVINMYSKNFVQNYIPYGTTSHQWPQVFAIFVASLGMFSFGTLYAWTSPSIPILISNSSHIDTITLEQASYFTVLPPIALAISAPFLAVLLDVLGRKKIIIFMAVVQFTSWLLIAFANGIYLLYASRLITGIGDAICFSALPTYVGEIALPNVRGSWGNLLVISTYLGQFLINVVGSYCDIRTTAFIFMCIPIVQIFLMILLPESPYFLLMKGREDETRTALKRLRWMDNVEKELTSLTDDVQRQVSESGTIKDMLSNPTNRKALLVCIAMRAAQQFSGLPAFSVYTQYMFNEAGGNISASTSTMIYTAALTCAVTGFAFVVDKFGRKPLMSFSCLGCCIILAIEATYFYVEQETNLNTSHLTWLPLTGMLIYIITCSSGLVILPTLMLGELFSASIKSKALSIVNICFAVYLLSVSKIFQILTSNVGMYVPFYFFSVCCFVSLIFSYFCVPETKGKTLEEIQQILRGKRTESESELIP